MAFAKRHIICLFESRLLVHAQLIQTLTMTQERKNRGLLKNFPEASISVQKSRLSGLARGFLFSRPDFNRKITLAKKIIVFFTSSQPKFELCCLPSYFIS